jgi:hypothetical protein
LLRISNEIVAIPKIGFGWAESRLTAMSGAAFSEKCPPVACAAVIILSSFAALSQVPAAEPAKVSSGQADHSALPDVPMPVPAQTQNQTAGTAQEESLSAQPPTSAAMAPKAEITVLEDTLIRVMTNEPVSSRHSKDGVPVLFTLSEDVMVDNVLAIPRGVAVHGEIVQTSKAGVLTGSPELTLKLVSLDLGGRSYPLYTYLFKAQGTSKTKPTETKIKGGAVVGAIVGGVFSGSAKGGSTAVSKAAGMATGAAVGAGVGTVVSASTPGPSMTIPAESEIDFHLASPISVKPVSAKEAARLSQGLRHGGPVLYVRGDAP